MRKIMSLVICFIMVFMLMIPLDIASKGRSKTSQPRKPKLTVTTKYVTLDTRKIKGKVSKASKKTYVQCYKADGSKLASGKVKNGKFTLKVSLNEKRVNVKPGDKIKIYAYSTYRKNGVMSMKRSNTKTFTIIGMSLSVMQDKTDNKKLTLTTYSYGMKCMVSDNFTMKKLENNVWKNVAFKENIAFPPTIRKSHKYTQNISLEDYFNNITSGKYKISKPGIKKEVEFTITELKPINQIYVWHGAFGQKAMEYKISLKEKSFWEYRSPYGSNYKKRDETASNEGFTFVDSLSDDKIDLFVKELNKHGFQNWEERYVNPKIFDGHQWGITIDFSDGSKKSVYGSNKYPDTWKDVKNAFKNLTGNDIL